MKAYLARSPCGRITNTSQVIGSDTRSIVTPKCSRK